MQLDNTRIVIRERSFAEVLDLSLRVTRRYFGPLVVTLILGIAPLFALPGNLVEAKRGKGAEQRKAAHQRIEQGPGVKPVHPHGQHDADNGVDQRQQRVMARLFPEIGRAEPQGVEQLGQFDPADHRHVDLVARAGNDMKIRHDSVLMRGTPRRPACGRIGGCEEENLAQLRRIVATGRRIVIALAGG